MPLAPEAFWPMGSHMGGGEPEKRSLYCRVQKMGLFAWFSGWQLAADNLRVGAILEKNPTPQRRMSQTKEQRELGYGCIM